MTYLEIDDIVAMFRRRIANDQDVHAAEIALKLVAEIERLRVELETERMRRYRLEGRVMGRGFL